MLLGIAYVLATVALAAVFLVVLVRAQARDEPRSRSLRYDVTAARRPDDRTEVGADGDRAR
jgi:hypothetical protein